MQLSTTPYFYGYEITETKGIVFSDIIYGANAIKDMFASLKDFTGGSVGSYKKIYERARQDALKELISDAQKMGANAIVGIDFQINSVGKENTILQLSAHGTAVFCRPSEK